MSTFGREYLKFSRTGSCKYSINHFGLQWLNLLWFFIRGSYIQ
jgi:hypothetical protein